MSNNEHQITPPPELVQQLWSQCPAESENLLNQFATLMARWGADQELEACCEWLFSNRWDQAANELHAARRPKPPRLKEEALAEMELLETHGVHACCLGTLRRALESLPS